MSAITIEIPDEKYAALKCMAENEQLSIQEFTDRALSEAIDARRQLAYLKKRAEGANWEEFQRILDKVPDVPPIPGDELPEGYESPNKH
jgi:hypothetical protein